ncbi:inositol polyphosphate kinase-domain-containing protein [Pelagophyceae sp. CCMP2097]|nr:inositol polyphosphate kinase-domain-containing protein [Pelagophyceae sp. CCMP2097]
MRWLRSALAPLRRFGAAQCGAGLLAAPPALLVLGSLVAGAVATWRALRRKLDDAVCGEPDDSVCGDAEWTTRRGEARGAEFAQRVLAGLFEPMATQVGGMQHMDGKRGMMSLRNAEVEKPTALLAEGRVPLLKAMQSRLRGVREVSFYEGMSFDDARWAGRAKGADFDKRFGGLRPFICGYHGVVKLAESDCRDQGSYIILDDCTAGMTKPAVLDVKMGTTTIEPSGVSEERRRRELQKYPEQRVHGMRVVGMRCWRRRSRAWDVHDKAWGLSLRTHAQLQAGFGLFFGADRDELRARRPLIAEFERRCRCLLEWFEVSNRELNFFSSSLLFVYDAADPGNAKLEFRMIDFTHVRREGVADDGYIHGLRRLVDILAALQRD